MRVAVVGGGIIGLASAVRLQEAFPHLDLTLISDQFTPLTTGDGSAGFWSPVYLGKDIDKDKVRRWAKETYNYIAGLWRSPQAGDLGVGLLPCLWVSSEDLEDPFWKDVPLHYRNLTPKEMQELERGNKLKFGVEYITLTCEPTQLLPYFMKKFQDNGGKIFEKKVTNIQSLSDRYDIVVNCTGLGARSAVPDPGMYPIRGQVMRVDAPFMRRCILYDGEGKPLYCLPNKESVVLGGTTQYHNWSTDIDPDDERHIREGWAKLYPSLKSVKKLKDWAGLRPGRASIRLEREVVKNGTRPFQVIHNYGHGGSGVTLFWGCAADVVELMKECVTHTPLKAKL